MVQHNVTHLVLFLPGLMLMPVVSLVPAALGRGVPLSLPNEEIKSAGRSMKMMIVMLVAMAISAVAAVTYKFGYIWWMILAEAVILLPVYFGLLAFVSRKRWNTLE